nr:TIGR02536 family ethanolamine utilization protein [uncultured Romboutsia sp.]
MDYNNLIEIIVEEVYKKINAINIGCIENENRKKAVILYESNKNKFDLLSDKFNIEVFDNTTNDCDVVIVSKLCMRGMCNLALGNSTSNEERFILKMLMKGKKVYVLDEGIEYKRYKDTAPKTLYNKYISYEDDICKYGVKIIKNLSEITFSEEKFNKEILSEEEMKIDDKFSIDLTHKKLVSESDLRKPMINGTKNIIVSPKSIITPLAMDFIRIHNITVKRI